MIPFLLLPALCATVPVCPQEEAQEWDCGPTLHRLEELFQLTDGFGGNIWPGFDTRAIPIAINHDDVHELLVGHPRPPEEYRSLKVPFGEELPVFMRDGCSRFGPRGGGWSVTLGGEETAYVSTLQENESTEDFLSVLLHECFHVYQGTYRETGEGPFGELPELDARYSALIGLESRVLSAALTSEDLAEAELRRLASMVVAVRTDRRRHLDAAVVNTEGRSEYSEGTATYTQARLFELLAEKGGVEPVHSGEGSRYRGYVDADQRYRKMLGNILPASSMPITFFHSQYHLGMALGLLLDRVRPCWKEEMRAKGVTLFELLSREFPLEDAAAAELLGAAKDRYGFEGLLAQQTALVETRKATIMSFLERPGRRYRIYHSGVPGRFKWIPKGPVYKVPENLTPPYFLRSADGSSRVVGQGATIWVGGIQTFEKPGLFFSSKEMPVVFGPMCFEWIDPEPTEEGKEMVIKSESSDGNVHIRLHLTTPGFELSADRARLVITPETVEIHPLPTHKKP